MLHQKWDALVIARVTQMLGSFGMFLQQKLLPIFKDMVSQQSEIGQNSNKSSFGLRAPIGKLIEELHGHCDKHASSSAEILSQRACYVLADQLH
jgi:hypothetical protein